MTRLAQILTALTAPPHLKIQGIGGPARGAALQLTPGRHIFSSGAADGAGETAARLMVAGAGDAQVSVRVSRLRRTKLTLEAGAALLNDAPMSIGAPVTLARSLLLTLGASTLKLTPAPSAARTYAGPTVLIAAVLGATALPARNAPPVLAAAPASVAWLPLQSDPGMATRAAEALRERLAAAGLAQTKVSTAPEAGVVTAQLPSSARGSAEWIAVREWFDRTWGAQAALDARFLTTSAPLSLPFAIRSAWSAPSPIVVLHDGSRRHLGDVLPGGWTLTEIRTDSAVVRRADQVVDIKF